MEELLKVLRERYGQLPPKQRQVVDVILTSPAATSYSTAADLAATAGVTQATVVRLCQALGFAGYAELRTRLRAPRGLDQLWPLDLMQQGAEVLAERPALASIRRDTQNLQHLLTPEFQEELTAAVPVIANAERVLVISSGSHASIGLILTHFLNFMGRFALLENRGGSYLGQALALLTPKDAVVTCTFWKVQPQVVRALKWCRGEGIPTLAITDSPFSPTAREAANRLVVPTEGVSFFRSMAAAVVAVNALLAELPVIDREHTLAGITRAQTVWKEIGVFEDEPGE